MNIPQAYKDARWWKSYLIYVVILAPFIVLVLTVARRPMEYYPILAVGVIVGLSVKDRIQRKVWHD